MTLDLYIQFMIPAQHLSRLYFSTKVTLRLIRTGPSNMYPSWSVAENQSL